MFQILMLEKLFAEAWQVVRSHGCSRPQLLALAQATEQSHPGEGVSTYAEEVERLVGLGGQHNYEAAGELIARMHSIRERLGQTADHGIFLAEFVGRHKAKRNLMKIVRANAVDGPGGTRATSPRDDVKRASP